MRKLYTKLTTSVLTRAFLSNQSKKSQARCSLASHIYKPQKWLLTSTISFPERGVKKMVSSDQSTTPSSIGHQFLRGQTK